jgi:hypothetical protein
MVNFYLLKVQKRKYQEKQVQTIDDPFLILSILPYLSGFISFPLLWLVNVNSKFYQPPKREFMGGLQKTVEKS